MPGIAGGKTGFSTALARTACGIALNSALLRALLLAGMLPAFAHSVELSTRYLMNMAEPASLHGSTLLCEGTVRKGPPAHTAG